MNFRNAVILSMIAFIVFISYMVFVITNESSELIAEDYYDQEQTIDADIAARARAKQAGFPIVMKEKNGLLHFESLKNLAIVKLHVKFMCYNDKNNDLELDLHLGESFPVAQLKKGTYDIELRYQINESTFLQQTSYIRK